MFQGNSAKAKAYRNFVSSPEGKEQIDRYQCCGSTNTSNGYPGKQFTYSTISDSNWKNARCNNLDVISTNGIF
jgi:hypothetical protein